MSYSIKIKRSAAKDLHSLSSDDRRRLVAAIDRLAGEPLAGPALKGELLRRFPEVSLQTCYHLSRLKVPGDSRVVPAHLNGAG